MEGRDSRGRRPRPRSLGVLDPGVQLLGERELQSVAERQSCRINGTRVLPPVKGMRYATLPGISPKLFRAGGSNTLEIEFNIAKKSKKSRRRLPWRSSR